MCKKVLIFFLLFFVCITNARAGEVKLMEPVENMVVEGRDENTEPVIITTTKEEEVVKKTPFSCCKHKATTCTVEDIESIQDKVNKVGDIVDAVFDAIKNAHERNVADNDLANKI